MEKRVYLAWAIITGVLCVGMAAAPAFGYVPFWLSGAAVAIAFPFFILTLYLWWTFSEKEGDIPFIGY